jgi:hypothetical protein
MVGRNFWAVPVGEGWIVKEEGLPAETTSHPSREDAWAAANARAQELEGEAFLADEEGAVMERKYYGQQPPDMKI